MLICPDRYIDCTRFIDDISRIEQGRAALFRLTLTGEIKGFDRRKNMLWSVPDEYSEQARVPKKLFWQTRRVQLSATDQSGRELFISSFGSPAIWANASKGDTLHVIGSYQIFGRKIYFLIEEQVPASAVGAVWVKYAGVPGQISGERIALAVAAAKIDESSWRYCASKIVGACGLPEPDILHRIESRFHSLETLLRSLHQPASAEEGVAAQEDARRISALALQTAALRSTTRLAHPQSPIPIDPQKIQDLIASQSERLTEDQHRVIKRIGELLAQPKAMTALLSGDVGTGKTLTYLVPAVAAHLAGAKVAIMAPTNLLADQIAQQIVQRFGSFVRGIQRLEAGNTIADHNAILVGTSGMVSAATKSSYTPNLLICDEQHKMGAAIREEMQAPWTHLLEVSATPIPRSLATALYDGMEILNLKQSPVRKQINSYVVDMGQKREILRAVRARLERGERCAFIYPAVTVASESDGSGGADTTAHTVESAYAALESAFPGMVVMLHGQMSQDQIRDGIAQLRSGQKLIMVASTVVETGLDIPSISLMVVRYADRFGISQLHQLRGRLVRNGGTGDFLMAIESFDQFPCSEDGSPHPTLQRLDAVATTTDGYELAERDLLLRGFGDFLGDAQTGAAKTVFRLADLKIEHFMASRLRSGYLQ